MSGLGLRLGGGCGGGGSFTIFAALLGGSGISRSSLERPEAQSPQPSTLGYPPLMRTASELGL